MSKEKRIEQAFSLDFLIVGAEKSGTTWLADMLSQHEQIFIPEEKELHYFNRKFVEFPTLDNYNFDKPLAWYLSFFEQARQEQQMGEICPSYLWDENAPSRIKKEFPTAKIVIVLREPVERTYSAYRFYQQRGVIPLVLDFRKAVKTFHLQMIQRSLYYEQVLRYINLFGEKQVFVTFVDDLKADNKKFLREIELFLGVCSFIPQNIDERSYVTGLPKYRWINVVLAKTRYFIRKFHLHRLNDFLRNNSAANIFENIRQTNKKEVKPTELDEIAKEDQVWLYHFFQNDVEKLERLLKKDLKNWKKFA